MRVQIGSWTCRSGNNLEVYLDDAGADGVRPLIAQWDTPPPLSPSDQIDYDIRILPAIARRVQEYLEKPGAILVVRP